MKNDHIQFINKQGGIPFAPNLASKLANHFSISRNAAILILREYFRALQGQAEYLKNRCHH